MILFKDTNLSEFTIALVAPEWQNIIGVDQSQC
jgi:hypothetical protein